MKSEFKARPVYLQKDNRIEAHFLTCFIALMFIRILENRTGNKLTIEKLVDTLRGYNFYHCEGSGYIPTYTRNDATDILHEAFGFRTDYQINGEKNMKKIIKKTKRQRYYYIFKAKDPSKSAEYIGIFEGFLYVQLSKTGFYPTFKSYARWTYCSNFNSLYCSKEKDRKL